MKRSWTIWLAFVLCLAVVLAAMGWVSLSALRLDRAERRARRQAALEENVRLALWRMDTAVAPILAAENARPYFAYSTFLPMDRAYGRMFNASAPGGEMLTPSPLLGELPPYVLVHFQFGPDGTLTSPRVPEGDEYKLAVPVYFSREAVDTAQARLHAVRTLVEPRDLVARLPAPEAPDPWVVMAPGAQGGESQQEQPPGIAVAQRREQVKARGKGAVEYFQRGEAVAQVTQNYAVNAPGQFPGQAVPQAVQPMVPPAAIHQGEQIDMQQEATFEPSVTGAVMTPLWVRRDLLLARRVSVGEREYVQGCRLDWPKLKGDLLLAIEDLLPEADLAPLPGPAPENESRLLASLPAALVPGRMPQEVQGGLSPIVLTLFVAWACVLVAAVATAALLAGVLRLSERRAAFVSAVTHELRTPLTTFHMYTEMLAEGMVPDESQKQHYLGTLRTEASRLSHLVENVLSYARLERGRADGRVEEVDLAGWLDQARRRLGEHAAAAGMELAIEVDPSAESAVVRANPSALEQVLLNLVDNACKYAGGATDKRIHLAARRRDGAVELRVRDHGPGISPHAARRLFRPFSKSAREAAHSAPGVGLGLALSRRLARDMGGRLVLDPGTDGGACFVVTLPTA